MTGVLVRVLAHRGGSLGRRIGETLTGGKMTPQSCDTWCRATLTVI